MQSSFAFLAVLPLVVYYGIAMLWPRRWNRSVKNPVGIDVVDLRTEFMSVARASLRQVFGVFPILMDGYQKYCRYEKPFLIHDTSGRQEVVIPPSYLPWFLAQPDAVLNPHGVREERHSLKYLHMGSDKGTVMPIIQHVAADTLTHKLTSLQPAMHAELRHAIDTTFGPEGDFDASGEGEWNEITLHSAFERVVTATIVRVFLGPALSRDKAFVAGFKRFIDFMGLSSIVVGQLPSLLRPVVGRAVSWPLWWVRQKTLAVMMPFVERELSRNEADDLADDKQSFIRQCGRVAKNLAANGKGPRAGGVARPIADVVTECILILGFAGIPTVAWQVTNLLIDIANCPKEDRVVERLRLEAQSVLCGHQHDVNPWHLGDTFKNMPLTDSVLCESFRLRTMMLKGLAKEVMPKDGLALADSGLRIPAGSRITVPVLGIHHDERFYSKPETYQPFRFVDSPERMEAGRPATNYLPFSYGKHACPGRWFAVRLLKMMVAYVVLHYDIEAGTGPSQTTALGDFALPPMSATIRVRRRKT